MWLDPFSLAAHAPLRCSRSLLGHRLWLWLGVVLPNCFRTSGGLQLPAGSSHRYWPAAPLAISQVRCRRSLGSVIAHVKMALRAQFGPGEVPAPWSDWNTRRMGHSGWSLTPT
jgi:hypothetical protein